MKTITANFASRKSAKFSDGHTCTYPARVDTYTQDDAGRWSTMLGSEQTPVAECDVIDACRSSTNWQDIRKTHFAMDGFES